MPATVSSAQNNSVSKKTRTGRAFALPVFFLRIIYYVYFIIVNLVIVNLIIVNDVMS